MPQLGMWEIIVIFFVALLVFGPRKLPELGKSLGKGLREFRRATNDLKASWEEQVRDIDREVSSATREANRVGQDLKNTIHDEPSPKPTPPKEEKPASAPTTADGTETEAQPAPGDSSSVETEKPSGPAPSS